MMNQWSCRSMQGLVKSSLACRTLVSNSLYSLSGLQDELVSWLSSTKVHK